MKQTTKNSYIIGLVLFMLGEAISIFKIIREALFFLPGAISAEVNSAYIITDSVLTYIVPIIIKLIIAFIMVFMIIRILKNIKSKCLIPLLCCSIVFLIISLLASSSTLAIPRYLIYSKLGLTDTLWVYFISYLTNGTIFSMASYIIILIASIQTLKQKTKEVENDR